MPDFERRSSASFISSKDGGTPASFRRSWMKRSSSNCFRVNIFASPVAAAPRRLAETNHEQTLYVRYVFRNHLIWRERTRGTARALRPWQPPIGSKCSSQANKSAFERVGRVTGPAGHPRFCDVASLALEREPDDGAALPCLGGDRKSTRLNSSHEWISYAVFCLK